MARRNEEWQDELARELSRAGGELARGIASYVAVKVEQGARRAEQHALEARTRQERRRAQFQQSKLERRLQRNRQRREAKYGQTSPVQGWLALLMAAAVLAVVFAMPQLWWLVFVALMFASRGGNILGYHARKKRVSRGEEPEIPLGPDLSDPRRVRVDDVCNRLLAALKDAPEQIRTFLSQPEATVESLRKTCHELLAREQGLRALANPEDDARLDRERVALTARIDAERDPETKAKLASARDALDERRRQSEELTRHASRLEAEHTRLTYTLEGLYAQVMRMKTAGAPADAGEGLKHSLRQLREEVGALADALEAANKAPVPVPEGLGPEAFGEGGEGAKGGRIRD